jgi:deazaflavin-dependent oxidoreductase (nitroreductase family)
VEITAVTVQTRSNATPRSKDTLRDRLERYREIRLSVIGRKSGRWISRPVWFVAEGDKLYLLPVQGSDTQWYKNVLRNPRIRISARGAEAEFKATIVKDPKVVAAVVDKFREKYGKADVKRYYSKFDAAVVVNLSKGETVSAENDTEENDGADAGSGTASASGGSNRASGFEPVLHLSMINNAGLLRHWAPPI